MAYRSTNETVYSAKYHLIWRPKYRCRVLVAAVKTRWAEVIGEVCGEHGLFLSPTRQGKLVLSPCQPSVV